MFRRICLALVAVLALAVPAFAQDYGFFYGIDCTILNPVNDQTWCGDNNGNWKVYHNGAWVTLGPPPDTANILPFGYYIDTGIAGSTSRPRGGSWIVNEIPLIDVGGAGAWDEMIAGDPWLMRDPNGTTYYLFYFGADASSPAFYQEGYAVSQDLINWTKNATNPVLTKGNAGAWDSQGAGKGAVIQLGNTYYMYYDGMSTTDAPSGGPSKIGVATASSLAGPWTKYAGNPILTGGTEGNGDVTVEVDVPSPFVYQGTVYLFYRGRKGAPDWRTRIYYATSTDGVTFTRRGMALDVSPAGYPSSPIGYPPIPPSTYPPSFDAGWIGPGRIIQVGRFFLMSYNGGSSQPGGLGAEPDPAGHGFAFSTDLVTWSKYSANSFLAMDTKRYSWRLWRTSVVQIGNNFYNFFNATSGGRERTFLAAFYPTPPTVLPYLEITGNLAVNAYVSTWLPATVDVGGVDLGTPADASSGREVRVGANGGNTVFRVGQDSTHNGYLMWAWGALASDASLRLETFGGSNPLLLQGSGGYVGIGKTDFPTALLDLTATGGATLGTPATREMRIGVAAGANVAIVRVGQDSTHNGYVAWYADATPANATLNLSTWGGNNALVLQDAGGLVKIPYLPNASPGAGTKALWYDPADDNRVKFAP